MNHQREFYVVIERDEDGYYVHNGKSVRMQTLFSNGLNYD